jgi:hypothetical protein
METNYLIHQFAFALRRTERLEAKLKKEEMLACSFKPGSELSSDHECSE